MCELCELVCVTFVLVSMWICTFLVFCGFSQEEGDKATQHEGKSCGNKLQQNPRGVASGNSE